MKITISGNAGAGKGTVAQLLTERLGWPVVSAGNFKREMAVRAGMTILEYDQKFTSVELDKMIDDHTKDFCARHENAIVDAWRGWFHVPDSLKIFLKCDVHVAAERIYAAKRGSVEAGNTVSEIEKKITERLKNNQQLMLKHNGTDLLDMNNYDLVIDTTNLAPEEVCLQILQEVKVG